MCCQWFNKKSTENMTGVQKVVHIVVWVIVGIVVAAVFATLFAFVVMWLWNALMPDIFGLTTINYWQALGIVVLSKLLFGGFHGKDNHDKSHRSSSPHSHISDEISHEVWSEIKEEFEEACAEDEHHKYHKYWKEEGKAAFREWLKKEEAAKASVPEED